MTADEYRAAFEEAVGTQPSEEFLDRVRAAQAAGMEDTVLLDCLAYEAPLARTFAKVYGRAYGEERGREKTCEAVYLGMKKAWKAAKKAERAEKAPP